MKEPSSATDSNRRKEIRNLARKYDHLNMEKVIERSPEQIDYALSDPNLPVITDVSFNRAIVIGVGGSALPADVLNDAFSDSLRTPIMISRYYSLLSPIDDRTLIIVSSFSGNTEEALAAAENLPPDSNNVIMLTAGGRLATFAAERGYPLVRVPREREPEGFQPRCATGYMVTYLARILANVGILREPEGTLTAVVAFLRKLDVRSEAESTAYWFSKNIPIFYTDAKYERSIARIAKIKHNENVKRPAFFNSLPEANHNEMIGFSRSFGKFAFLYLRDPASHHRVHQRFDVMQSVFYEKHMDYSFREWTIPGSTKVEKIFAALMFLDWCSYTLALLDGIDPTPVGLVEDFKKALNAGRSS